MRNLNQFIVQGFIGRISFDGNALNITLFVGDDYKDNNSEEWIERRYALFLSAFGKPADAMSKVAKKGDFVTAIGKLSSTPNDGSSYKLFLNIDKIYRSFGDNKNKSGSEENGNGTDVSDNDDSTPSASPKPSAPVKKSKWTTRKQQPAETIDIENLDDLFK